ncbi:hypothetical protein G6F57_021814 [Rhizopus arrhizus]|nr:hypothetical protein G6F57_021814 [Rhizopus arrhizus]
MADPLLNHPRTVPFQNSCFLVVLDTAAVPTLVAAFHVAIQAIAAFVDASLVDTVCVVFLVVAVVPTLVVLSHVVIASPALLVVSLVDSAFALVVVVVVVVAAAAAAV